MKSFYFHITAFDVHYFMLVWLSGEMRSSFADKRGFPVFIWWANIHTDTLCSYSAHKKIAQNIAQTAQNGPEASARLWFYVVSMKSWEGQVSSRARSTAAITSTVEDILYLSFIAHFYHTIQYMIYNLLKYEATIYH